MNALLIPKRAIFAIALMVMSSCLAEDASGQLQYAVTDLGTFTAGASSLAFGINNLGQVVGNANNGGYANAFLYSGGSLQNLGTLGGMASSAADINNAGQVVGEALTSSGVGQAFLYSGGSMQGLGTVPVGGTSYATGINNVGQVVWYSNAASQAYLYSGGSTQSLGTLSAPYNARSVVNGINDNGQAVGGSFASTSGYVSNAFLFSVGSMQNLGTVPAQPDSVATSINNLGQVVGYVDTNGAASHAFLSSGGSMQSLGTLPGGPISNANAINNLGQVVGEALVSGAYHAFLYSGGTMQDLNSLIPSGSTLTLNDATGINNSGQICGYGTTPSGQTMAFLLTRTSSLAEQWAVNGGGVWSTPSNWTDSAVPGAVAVPGAASTASLALGVPGGIAQDSALFGTALTSGTATVILDTSRTLAGLSFDTSGGASYEISPSGASTLILSNTTAGSVTISDSGGNHTINAPITLGSNLSVSATTGSILTIGGVISGGSGSFSLTVSGGGALILSAANTSTGTTTISAGSLQIGNGGATGSLSPSSPIVDNGTLVFSRSNTVAQGTDFSAAGISGSGSLTQAGVGLLVINAVNTYSGTTTVSGGVLQLDSSAGSAISSTLVVSGGTAQLLQSNQIAITANVAVSAGMFNIGANSNTGNGLQITGGTIAGTTGVLTSATAFDAENGVIGAILAGTGGLNKTTAGTVVLAAANTYSGTTTISAGTLVLANSNAMEKSTAAVNAAANCLAFAPGIGTFNLGGLAGSGGFALADLSGAAVGLQVGGNGANTTYSGTLSGPGSLTQTGPGTLVLTASNSYTGGTTILAGAIQLGNGGATGSIAGNVLDNGLLAFNLSGISTFAGVISGFGDVTQMGPGTLVLTASNTYSGGTTISAGALQVGNGGGTGCISGNVLDNGSLLFSRSDTLTFGGAISGSGNLTQVGPGTLILTASNSYSGGTTISAGTLQIDNGGTSGSITGNVTNNAVLAFDRSDSYTFAGNVSGSGTLMMNGPGALTLTGTVSSGNFTVNQGQIIAGPNSTVDVTGNLTIPAGRRFTSNNGSGFFVANLSNSGTFIGGGTVIDSFVNAASGVVRIGSGQTLLLLSTSEMSNAGMIEVFGTGASQAQFEPAGPFTNASGGLIAAQNATFYFDGGLTNQATVAFTGGASNVFGQVTNSPGATINLSGGAGVTFYDPFTNGPGATITLIGGAMATFYGSMVQNGTLDVTTIGGTSSAVFLGSYSGSGAIIGGGVVEMLGDPVLSGDLSISTPLLFAGDLDVTESAGQTLKLSGDVSGDGAITLSGGGQLILSGTNTYGGATTVTAGTLYVTDSAGLPNGNSLTVGGGAASIFDPSATAAAMASPVAISVPEPGSLALFGAGALALLGYVWRRRALGIAA